MKILNRDTFLGNLSPITGALLQQILLHIFIQVFKRNINWCIKFTPSFAPGLYHEGDGKDLGHMLEFKSEVQLSLNLSEKSN